MPELLRAYGEALQQEQTRTGVVLLGLALVTLVLLGVFAPERPWSKRRDTPGAPGARHAAVTFGAGSDAYTSSSTSGRCVSVP